ncbi:MAG: alpha/beta hydrolase [Candidatus Moraniibacteriota bacterium]
MLEKQVIIEGLNINYFQSDDLEKERVVVFLHGWGSRAAHLQTIFANLSSFIALDLPGFGGSDLPASPWGVTEFSGFLDSFLLKLEIKNPILVGHSVGGSIIIKYLSVGGMAKKAILIDSSGIRKRGLKIFAYKIITKIFKVIFLLPGLNIFKDNIRKKFYSAINSVDYIEAGKMAESYKKIIREDLTDDLSKVKTETVLIWGEKDQDTPLWQAKLMREKMVGSKLFVISNAGHFSFIDQPQEFMAIFSKEM